MLLVGTNETLVIAASLLSKKNKVHIVNLSSAYLGVQPSSLFYVPRCSNESFEYDLEYGNFIFQNTQQRIEFLYLMHQLQIGNDVLILIGTHQVMFEMAESLLKLIQMRYGYNGYFITKDDLDYIFDFQSNFSVPGLQLFDQEKVELDEIFLEEEKRKSNGY